MSLLSSSNLETLALANRFRKFNGPIAIVESPRGGSTWLADLLRTAPDTAMIYEPLGLYIPRLQALGIPRYVDIAESGKQEEYKKYFDDILKGVFLKEHLILAEERTKLRTNTRWLLKFIKGHFNLLWFDRNFPKLRKLIVIRNPYAVVASQRAYEGPAQFFLSCHEEFDHPKSLNAFQRNRESELASCQSELQKLTAAWCVTTAAVMEQWSKLDKGNSMLLFYEDVVTHAESEWEKIKSFCEVNAAVPNFKKPSHTAQDDRSNYLEKWRERLTDNEISEIAEVLGRFDKDWCYDQNGLPADKLRDRFQSKSE